MPRDYQRSSVYRAEVATFGCKFAAERPEEHKPSRCWLEGECFPAEPDLDGTREDAQSWLDKLSRSATWKRLAGWPTNWGGGKPLVDRLMIDPDYRGRKVSRAGNRLVEHRGRYYHGVSIAPAHYAYSYILLHEACHVATWHAEQGNKIAVNGEGGGHGPLFTGTYVAASRWAYSEERAEQLMAAFIDRGCDVDTKIARTR